MALTLWHNPRCSTSRRALALLQERGLTPAVRLYLTDPPALAELQALDLPPAQLIRWKDAPDLPRDTAPDHILARLVAEPRLIERPILLSPNGAAIGRPPEALLGLL